MSSREEREKQVFKQKLVLVISIAVIIIIIIVKCVAPGRSDTGNATSETAGEIEVISAVPQEQAESASTLETASKTDSNENTSSNTSSTATIGSLEPENEDGTGQAGQLGLNDYRSEEAKLAGWYTEDAGIWYSLGEGFCYYTGWKEIDGQTYHFDSLGYAARGWQLIGGQSCYFDDNGVYVPDKDNSKVVAFTFDDGPSAGIDSMLELCEETGARVTFFMIGAQVDGGGAVIPSIVKHRCELGNHSDTHENMLKLSTEESNATFNACDSKIASFNTVTGAGSTVIRYPYGNYTTEEITTVGKPAIMWSIDTLDWKTLDKDAVIATIRGNIEDGDIVLMHDRHEAAIEACRELFPELISQGYQLVTVSELAAAKGVELEPGYTYFDFCPASIESGSYRRNTGNE